MKMQTTNPEEVGFSVERLERVTAGVQGYIDRRELAGTVTAVMRRGNLAYFHTAGMANLETNQPMQADTLFRIYSMTKPITACSGDDVVRGGAPASDRSSIALHPCFQSEDAGGCTTGYWPGLYRSQTTDHDS
jgi:hypothetical protein